MDKKEYVQMVDALFKADKTEVAGVEYKHNGEGARVPEVVTITYKGGYMADINVTGNSNIAILEEITKEVCTRKGALGTFWRGFAGEREEER